MCKYRKGHTGCVCRQEMMLRQALTFLHTYSARTGCPEEMACVHMQVYIHVSCLPHKALSCSLGWFELPNPEMSLSHIRNHVPTHVDTQELCIPPAFPAHLKSSRPHKPAEPLSHHPSLRLPWVERKQRGTGRAGQAEKP